MASRAKKLSPDDSAPRRPYILCNMAMSADGKIASRSGYSRFGSVADERHLYRLRADVDAIMSGAVTIDKEQATLTTQTAGSMHNRARKPLRIIITNRGSLPITAPIFSTPGPPILVITSPKISRAQLAKYQNVAAEVYQSETFPIDWSDALTWLATQWQVSRLLCEGGGRLNQSLIQAGFIDEIHLTICPVIVGGSETPTIADGEAFPNLASSAKWELIERRQRGSECFVQFRRRTAPDTVGG